MAMHENDQQEKGGEPALKPASRNIVRLIICLLLIAAGIGGARLLIATKPKVNKRPPVKMAPLIRTDVLQSENYTFRIPAMGTIVPAREISLEVPVSGEVIYMNPEFTQGGMLTRGTKILEINPNDAEAHFALGYIYRYAGMNKEAVLEMEKAVSIDPENPGFRSIIITYTLAGEYEKALAIYKEMGEDDKLAEIQGQIDLQQQES